MKFQVIILFFITLTSLFTSCFRNNSVDIYESAKSVDYEYFKKISTLKNNEIVKIVKITGIFDLKSLCLSFNPEKQETETICRIALARSGETNAEYIETLLKFCNNEIRANCIKPLPDNAPPEVIQILDKNSKVIEPWSKVEVFLRVNRKEQTNDIEVMQIESAK